MSDWTAFDRLLVSRRRAMVESFVEFLRLPSVSQEPEKVRATGEWLAAALNKPRGAGECSTRRRRSSIAAFQKYRHLLSF